MTHQLAHPASHHRTSSRARGLMRLLLSPIAVVLALALTSTSVTPVLACGSIPFVSLPETLGFEGCVGNNKNNLLKLIATTQLDCSLRKAHKMMKSKPLMRVYDLAQAMAKDPAKMSATFYEHMAQTGDDEMEAFCGELADKVVPCGEALLPDLLDVLEKDTKCCSELSDLSDLLNFVVPPTVSKASFVLQDLVNGVSQFFCARREDKKQTCGANMFQQLTKKYKKDEFRLLEHVVLPLVSMAKGEECDGMQGQTYSNTVSLKTSETIDYGCCAHHMRPLLESTQHAFTHALGTTPFEFLNGIVEFPKDSKAKFVNAISATKDCKFESKCTAPKLTEYKKRDIKPANKDPKKNALKDTTCKRVKKCDGSGEVCSEICEKGSVELEPWAHNALQYQLELAYRGPICLAQIPATHNSAINLADGYGNRDQLMNSNLNVDKSYSFLKTNNHVLSVTDQLNIGVRWLEIDVHYFLNELRTAHCGGFGSDSVQALFDAIKEQLSKYGEVLWSPDLLGCYPSLSGIRGEEQITTNQSMQEIRDWLDQPKNKDELVFIYLDTGSEIKDLKLTEQMNDLLSSVFGDLILPISELESLKDAGWSGVNATVQSFINQKRRVVLISNANTGLAYGIQDFCKKHQILDTKYIDDKPNADRVIGERTIYSGDRFLRAYQSALRYITLDDGGRVSRDMPKMLDSSNIANFVRWDVNLLAPDSLDVATMKAQIWSWAEEEPKESSDDGAVAFIRPDGRWITSSSEKTAKRACWKTDKLAWTIVPFADECPSGSVFALPMDPYQNYLLMEEMKTQKITSPVVINAPFA